MGIKKWEAKANKMPFYDSVDAYIQKTTSEAPEGLKNLKQGSGAWIFMPSEEMFVSNAIQGIAVAMSFAFVIVLFSTGNIINALIAIFCVAMVILSITAVFYINGQQFGTIESISVVVLIGFSVDYIIHYSADYIHSKEDTRELKMQQSLRQMGVSILGGYITTFGSGIFLVTCTFAFFYKFGQTISLTVTFAFLIATFTYSALMKVMGPEGNCGNIYVCIKKPEEPIEDDNANAGNEFQNVQDPNANSK